MYVSISHSKRTLLELSDVEDDSEFDDDASITSVEDKYPGQATSAVFSRKASSERSRSSSMKGSPSQKRLSPLNVENSLPRYIFSKGRKERLYDELSNNFIKESSLSHNAWIDKEDIDKSGKSDSFQDESNSNSSPSLVPMYRTPSPVKITDMNSNGSKRGSNFGSPVSVSSSLSSAYSSPSPSHIFHGENNSNLSPGSVSQAGLFFPFPSPLPGENLRSPDTLDYISSQSQLKSNKPKKVNTSSTDKAMKNKLRSITEMLEALKDEGTDTRNQLLANAETMVSNLPLKYLFSKPELRHYALDRAMKPIIRLMIQRINIRLKRAIDIWRIPPILAMSERQLGFLVIAKRFSTLLKPIYENFFNHWMKLYSSRYNQDEGILKNAAASQIQEWYRHVKITRRKVFQFFANAVQTCLQRRRAIKHMIMFERTRRSSLIKFTRAIARKRRKWFGARCLMRPYLWFKLYRKVQFKLTRKAFSRVIQRWYRMTQCRPKKDLYLIKNIIRAGGYYVVFPKIPDELMRRNGFLYGFEACASRIQRAWFVSKGNFAAFMIAAARRAKEEYEQMRNDNAIIIQHNFRGHLWNLLERAAIQHNRARKISFAFRHYQYRCWTYFKLEISMHKPIRMIQKWLRNCMCRQRLHERFVLRKISWVWANLKKTYATCSIQNSYRAYKERERIRLEELRKWIAEQRKNAEVYAKKITFIQKNWRKKLIKNMFPRHIYLICWRIIRKRRSDEYKAVYKIQKIARPFIKNQIEERKAWEIECANSIWSIAKAYLLKLSLYDRVEATKKTRNLASIVITKNLRIFMFEYRIQFRCRLRIIQKKYANLQYDASTYIQRWTKRKWIEYYAPVRDASRATVKKKRLAEQERFHQAVLNKASHFIQRFMAVFPVYNKNTILIEKERYRIRKIHMARRIQKFARRIISWSRFDRIIAWKIKEIALLSELERKRLAANVVGFYFKRRNEKYELKIRFRNRRYMIDEFNRLDALKIIAEDERAVAIEDKRRTDENMRATINASWKQGSDVSGKNYYYNYVTGESRWEPPEGWKAPMAIDKWIRQLDDRSNVYYYNMQTQESAWLPPCNLCGEPSEKYCEECTMAFCDRCFDEHHEMDGNETEENKDIRLHKWSLVEYAKDSLEPGDIYCLECKKRAAKRMCLTCWDPYCDECFRYTHHTGNLKYHSTMAYKKVKMGWMTIKAKSRGDPDYYVNGATGVTSYEKPYELMSEDEKRYYGDFLTHQKAAMKHVQTIEELQLKLEETSFERDSILNDALAAGFMGGSVQNALQKKKANKNEQLEDGVDAIEEVLKENKPSTFDWLMGRSVDYREKILKPKERERGAAKSEFMDKLLGDITKEAERKKTEEKAAKKVAKYG